jgi:predicted thioesterase
MKDTLKPGLSTTNRVTIDAARTIDFMGDEGRVYATPELVRDIENTCRNLLLAHSDAGEDSVGTRIEVDHIAATLLGMWVEITATVAEVEGRRVTFEISARDNVEEVARGKHARFVVDTAKTLQRLKGKAEKVVSK